MTDAQPILYQRTEAVGTITLNRPDELNPLDDRMVAELHRCFDQIEGDPQVELVVLRGAGRAFSAGGDLSSMGSGGTPLKATPGEATRPGTFVDLNLALTRVGKPTIAMVQGACIAEGCWRPESRVDSTQSDRVARLVRGTRAEQIGPAAEASRAKPPYRLLWSTGIIAFVLCIVAFVLWGINGASTLFDMMVALCT